MLSVDGKQVGIGDFGPLLLLHKPASGVTPTKEELQQWVWSVFYIEACRIVPRDHRVHVWRKQFSALLAVRAFTNCRAGE